MIAANYTANLYCDCPECADRARRGYPMIPAEYLGKSWDRCLAAEAKRLIGD